MDIEISTAALLFPTVSLLLLAFTNRFLVLAKLVRELVKQYHENPKRILLEQIHNLEFRLRLIRDMQALGVVSLFLCVVSMSALFVGSQLWGKIFFALSLLSLMISLLSSFYEIVLSTRALSIELQTIKSPKGK